ncbi:MAG: MFS transporter [Candidatus Omnitrophica bacterium CG08_land_8_20_14_0_20_41_16]|uniref:MFS transporter n=1 Tax=Candidatus Sherwoodlollariibacterium unditelluris TaxID=1974757 RepID=A0A2G9YIB1_9BACT|nr:MAG: MFS transporter [Candidatus Omnitrophica bacterium CG23_combo_of_CG06-09_8_20_14_all_41_10]PIS34274.1 MAG: MFS transporter [Candidatus Omnitrophica bacterium CG08_land_8_20_14_0_20_41_16]
MQSGNKKTAFKIIIIFGLVSLFGDMVYEAARSVNGPYLKTLGASAAIVGLVAGVAEFMGYAVRLASGYFADKMKAYWLFTFLGYGMLIVVPLLSLAGIWQVAVMFIVLERLGKALRSPAKDTILSQATKQVGTGFGFALAEVLDQIGAIIGPLIFTVLFILLGKRDKGLVDYQQGYSLLWIPFVLVLICVLFAYKSAPNSEILESSLIKKPQLDKFSKVFWLYTIFSFVTTLGFTNFALIGYHFKAKHVLTDAQIPLFYAIAMGVDAVAALIIGKTYDVFKNRGNNEKAGLAILIAIPVISIFIPIFAFSQSYSLALTSAIIWGIVMGAHETVMKSAIADLTTLNKRGTGYGIFNTAYGLAIFIGSALMGLFYEKFLLAIIIFSIAIQGVGILAFFVMRKEAVKI